MFFSKTDFDKKVEKITRKSLIDSDVFDVFVGREEFSETEDDGSGEEELEGDAVSAYTSYVTEVLSAFVFYANPTVNLEQALPKIKESARLTVKMSKYFFKVIFMSLHRSKYNNFFESACRGSRKFNDEKL